MDSPTVSVLLTVYNGEPYLEETVESVLDQTYEDFELVVVDDGSTDGTAGILSEVQDERIRLFDQPNRGRPQALNRGLMHCRGEYVAIIDDDDIASPRRLQRQVSVLENRPNVDVLGSWFERRFEVETPVSVEQVKTPVSDRQIRQALPNYNPLAHSSVTYRKAAVEQVGGYDVSLHSCVDYDLWIRLAAAGFQFAAVDEPLCTIRKHEDRSFDFSGQNQLRRWLTTWALQHRAVGLLSGSTADQLRVGARNAKILLEDIADELRR